MSAATYVSPASLTIHDDDETATLVVHIPHGKCRRRLDIPLTVDELLIVSANCADAARMIIRNRAES